MKDCEDEISGLEAKIAEIEEQMATIEGASDASLYTKHGELKKQLDADVLEITPADKTQKYEANGYAIGTQLLSAISDNPTDEGSYPEIDAVATDVAEYENVVIVTPLWWSHMAAIMQTYLFRVGPTLAGKHVALIVSSASSGIDGVVADAERLAPNAVWMGEPLWINNSNRSKAGTLLAEWLPTLDFKQKAEIMEMNVTVDGRTLTASLADTEAARTLHAALQQAPLTYEARDYGGFEKVGSLGRSLPTSDVRLTTTVGDIMLYSGNQAVIFYGSNTWEYTPLGRIENISAEELKTFLGAGQGNKSITFSAPTPTSVKSVQKAAASKAASYTSSGVRATANARASIMCRRSPACACSTSARPNSTSTRRRPRPSP